MTTRNRFAAVALAVALLAGCRHGRKPMEVDLEWNSTDDLAPTTMAISRVLASQRVQVMPFTDERTTKTVIGRNLEDPKKPVDVTAKADVGAWCSDQMKALFKKAGVDLVDSKGAVVVKARVNEFIVNEAEVYEGLVTLGVTVENGAGKKLWNGTVAGRSKRWGRTYKEENYIQTISDAYVHAVNELVNDEDFKKAVKQHT